MIKSAVEADPIDFAVKKRGGTDSRLVIIREYDFVGASGASALDASGSGQYSRYSEQATKQDATSDITHYNKTGKLGQMQRQKIIKKS